ncbi:MAG: TIGR02679 family protein [Xanthobacteraceae bacterium]|nr:TIGR02679 family protein [Xanthobacteraceae bacterium]
MTATATPNEKLLRLLGGDDLADLRFRLRRRYERIPVGGEMPAIHVVNLTEAERTALAGITGRRGVMKRSIRLDVATVDAALHAAGVAPTLRSALEALDGPILNREAEESRIALEWVGVVAGCRRADVRDYLSSPQRLGLLKRLSDRKPRVAAELCRLVESVLDRLPGNGIPRAQIAAEIRGDAHDLDRSRPLATLTLAILRSRTGDAIDDDERDVWAAAGVLVNELARPALFMNIPHADENNEPGEPQYFSLRRLARRPPKWQVAGTAVLVCENPNLVAILADRLETSCPPVACVDGNMGAAQQLLLRQLKAAGATLLYHGDYDWPGIAIGNNVITNYGAIPWFFSAADYSDAAAVAPKPGAPLTGQPVAATWDKRLFEVMAAHGIKVQEEAIAERIIDRLGREPFGARIPGAR